MKPLLIVPGLGDSGPSHWQTWLETHERGVTRVRQPEWNEPDLSRWSQRVRAAVQHCAVPPILIGHSFGALACIQAAYDLGPRVHGILLVAPADPSRLGIDLQVPETRLDLPAVLVASRNDPWMGFDGACALSARIGARLHDAGKAGHINVASGHGPWPAVLSLVSDVRESRPNDARSNVTPKRLAHAA